MEAHDQDDEKTKLLPSVIQASYTNVGVPSTVLEPPNVYASRWRSIRVMYLTMFLSSLSFSICMTSVWPYLQRLDKTATADFLGWVVASYSLGQFIASPLFGWWANFTGKSRTPLVVSLVINILANLLYAYLQDFNGGTSKWLMVVARSLIGFGAGNVAVVRAYVSGATTLKERTSAMANMSACQAVGFIIGPGLQPVFYKLGWPGPVHQKEIFINMYTTPALVCAAVSLVNVALLLIVLNEHSGGNDEHKPTRVNSCTTIQAALAPLDFPGPIQFPEFRLNVYTAPAWLSALVGLLNIVLLVIIFTEHRVIDDELKSLSSIQSRSPDILEDIPDYKPDTFAVVFSIILFFTTMFTFATFETIATPLTEDMYDWTKEDATLYSGIILAGAGATSVFVFAGIKVLSKRFNERYLIICGFLLTLCGFILWLPWGGGHLSYQISGLTPAKNASVEQIVLPITSDMTSVSPNINSTSEPVGCPISYEWCRNTPRLYLGQMLAGVGLTAVGYPTCNVLIYTLYSKILGPKPQGTMMGWLTAAGSGARTLGPIFVSQVYASGGPRIAFSIIAGVNLFSAILLMIIFKRMVPFRLKTTSKTISE